jgi:arylsulfatase A-like enzyme
MMPSYRLFALLSVLFFGSAVSAAETSSRPPDIVFIAVDDLNDSTQLHDPASTIRMPRLQGLAKRGVFFSRAYAASPACNPSRTAILTGLAPHTTGVYGNASDWRRALPEAVTLPAHFRANGYRVVGAGKIFHHQFDSAFHDGPAFHAFRRLELDVYPPARLTGMKAGSRNFDWGPWPPNEPDLPDVKTADWAIDWLARPTDEPFFLALGIYRPHSPHYAPARHFEANPPSRVRLPREETLDASMVAAGGRALLERDQWMRHFAADPSAANSRAAAIRAYQACATFADEQIGRVLDALERHPRGRDAIVVVWSDNGFHLGEKGKWEKFTLWEKGTRVPLIVVAPGVARAGAHCLRPVSLLDLYPTLLDLAGLPAKPGLHGESLRPLLVDPAAPARRPVLMTYERGNHAVRSDRWRYIRYADGSEEVYDHAADPDELVNLAGRPEAAEVIARHRVWLPAHNAPTGPDLKP